ncbi:hypothetical protein [Sphingomonas sp. SAFR-052]|uniref:hypothetical protein n=1 Tax=Sphingomonas sp. SAFR-052 TaxID=3436867 RepID=UPI003F809559
MTVGSAQVGLGDDTPPPEPVRSDLLRAVRLAAKCFEMAWSTPFPAERDAAISRGTAVAKKAGLRLELFKIPGRDQTEQQLRDALRDAAATRQRWADDLGAAQDETIYAAKRRAFDDATRLAAERDRSAGRRPAASADCDAVRRADLLDRWPSIGATINALKARRVGIRQINADDGSDQQRWHVPDRMPETLDQWQLRELADEVCA